MMSKSKGGGKGIAGKAMGKGAKAASKAKSQKKATKAAPGEAEYPYIVAGARMFCDKGSHFRRLDLPLCHGTYIRDIPMVNRNDSSYPDNVSMFGICVGGAQKNGTLMEYNGSNIEDLLPFEGVDFPIIGYPCIPKVGRWLNPKDDVLVDGVPAITTESTLVCIYGGVIGFVDDGQGV